jgi:hypothetical protein
MVLFSGSLMISDLGYQETEEVLLSRFNEMGISLWDSLDHPGATTYLPPIFVTTSASCSVHIANY